MFRTSVFMSLALLTAGCASTGVNVSEEQVRSFHKGSTTYAEVVSRLGPPSSETSLGNGDRVAIYSYGHYQVRAASFIPIVGMFAGGGDMHASAATFTFDANGVLTDWTTTQAAQGVVTGLGAGSMPGVAVRNRIGDTVPVNPAPAAAATQPLVPAAVPMRAAQPVATAAKPIPKNSTAVVCITCE